MIDADLIGWELDQVLVGCIELHVTPANPLVHPPTRARLDEAHPERACVQPTGLRALVDPATCAPLGRTE